MTSNTPFQQSTVFFAPPGDTIRFTTIIANPSLLGPSQCINLVSGLAGIAIGDVVGLEFQVAIPSPKIFLQLFVPAFDKITIQTPTGLLITLEATSGAPGGFNFQPSYGSTYILYFTAGQAYVVGQSLLDVQAIIENTVGQYIDIPSITWKESSPMANKSKVQIRQGVSGNTVSAVPNTIFAEFIDFPVERGMNFVLNFRVLVNANAVETFGGFGASSAAGSNSRSISLIAGQNYTATWNSINSGFITGTYSILIPNAGTLSTPATVPVIGIPQQRLEYNESVMGQVAAVGSTLSSLPQSSFTDSLDMMIPRLTDHMKNLFVDHMPDIGPMCDRNTFGLAKVVDMFSSFRVENSEAHMKFQHAIDNLRNLIHDTCLKNSFDNSDALSTSEKEFVVSSRR